MLWPWSIGVLLPVWDAGAGRHRLRRVVDRARCAGPAVVRVGHRRRAPRGCGSPCLRRSSSPSPTAPTCAPAAGHRIALRTGPPVASAASRLVAVSDAHRRTRAAAAAGGRPGERGCAAREAGQTHAAVWKRIRPLRSAGVVVEAVPGAVCLRDPARVAEAAVIRAAMAPAARLQLASLEVAWTLDSTNSELLGRGRRRTAARCCSPSARPGRGRRGRSWQSPLGAYVYLSVARRFDGGLARLAGSVWSPGSLPARRCTPGFRRVALKLNDLVVDDGRPAQARRIAWSKAAAKPAGANAAR